MNIDRTEPGTSFRFVCEVYGPDLPSWQLRQFWRAYWRASDRLFDMVTFFRLARAGHIVCAWVAERDPDDDVFDVVATFGLELMIDRHGQPYTQFIFFDRDPDGDQAPSRLLDMAPLVVETCLRLSMTYKDAERFRGEMRLLLKGRRGWRRVVRRLGLVMDEEGWISENQEVFHHGPVRQ